MHRQKSFKIIRSKKKYKNVPKDYNGVTYHSTFEAKVARDLEIKKRAGLIKDIKRQVKIELYAYDKHICNYIIDFVVINKDDEKEYIEVKGFETDVWRLKWKLFEAMINSKEPEAKLTIIKK